MRRILSLAIALVAISGPASGWTEPAAFPEATVVHVDDGDTIDVWTDGHRERVRYIGIDAPELAHDGLAAARGGEAATRLNRALLAGRRVRLEFDLERRDRYGRLLAYVWLGGTLINAEMVRRGYARVLTIPPNVRYQRWFEAAEAEAREARRGLWGDDEQDGPPATRFPRRLPRSGTDLMRRSALPLPGRERVEVRVRKDTAFPLSPRARGGIEGPVRRGRLRAGRARLARAIGGDPAGCRGCPSAGR